MQCKRCKTFFKYDKYDGICPQCAYFNRPPGMEEVDLFEDDKRFQTENYVLPQMEGIHMELHKKYDSDKKPHKKKKTAKNNAGHFSDYLEIKSKKNMETKKDAARHIIPPPVNFLLQWQVLHSDTGCLSGIHQPLSVSVPPLYPFRLSAICLPSDPVLLHERA